MSIMPLYLAVCIHCALRPGWPEQYTFSYLTRYTPPSEIYFPAVFPLPAIPSAAPFGFIFGVPVEYPCGSIVLGYPDGSKSMEPLMQAYRGVPVQHPEADKWWTRQHVSWAAALLALGH